MLIRVLQEKKKGHFSQEGNIIKGEILHILRIVECCKVAGFNPGAGRRVQRRTGGHKLESVHWEHTMMLQDRWQSLE